MIIGWDDMSPDEREVALFPVGHRYALVMASYWKWALANCLMSAAMRLEFLEGLERLVGDRGLNARALAEVRPCNETSVRMIAEALDSDHGERSGQAFKILTGREVFGALLRLNPTWLWAIRLCGYGTREVA